MAKAKKIIPDQVENPNVILGGHLVEQKLAEKFPEFENGGRLIPAVQEEPVKVEEKPKEEPKVVEVPKKDEGFNPETHYAIPKKEFNKLIFCLRAIGTIKQYIGVGGVMKIGALFGVAGYEESIKKAQEIYKEFEKDNA